MLWSIAFCGLSQQADYAITQVDVLTMKSEDYAPEQTLLIKNGKIIAMDHYSNINTDGAKTIIDGKGKFLIPGLTEMHAHIPGNQDMDLLEETLFLYLSNGITTIRGMLGQPYHLELKELVIEGKILGPRIYTSGPSINGNTVRSVEEARRKVTAQKEAGYDFLKLHPGLTRQNFDAVVATANEVGIPYAGHVSTLVGIRRALESEYATIDHVDGYMEGLVPDDIRVNPNANGFFGINFTDIVDEEITQELVNLTYQKDVWIVPTQAMMERWVGPEDPKKIAREPAMKYMNPNTVANWVATKENILASPGYEAKRAQKFNTIRRDIIMQLYDAGVKILLGSDAPQVFNVPGFSIQLELDAMVRSGMDEFDVLNSGTALPAEFFDAVGEYGTVEVGAVADLVLLDDDPLADIAHVAKQSGVMVRGKWISAKEIKSRLDQIEQKYKNQ